MRAQIKPLVTVIGATGTGKSQLAVDLALRFNGEIINSDALQLYDGLPIITNQIPVAERKGVPHHLLSCVEQHESPWTVNEFVENALQVIAEIQSRGRLPILVGGTHYYIQALLFNDALATKKQTGTKRDGECVDDSAGKWPILAAPTEEILSKLREVDPVMADRWHPNDRRKIQRSLEIWLHTGKKASETYAQQAQDRSNQVSSQLRFPSVVLWTHTEPSILHDRVDRRVDKMAEEGLLQEALALHKVEKEMNVSLDTSRGIWVAVGYKEFHDYFEALDRGEDAAGLLRHERRGLELTKIATWQYRKQQIKWIRIKLYCALRDAGALDRLLAFDTSDPEKWQEETLDPACTAVKCFLEGAEMPTSELVQKLTTSTAVDLSRNTELWQRRTCELCGVTATTEMEWKAHVQSRRHKLGVKKSQPGTLQNGGIT